MRATRVLHAADQEPFPAPGPDPGHHHRQPEGRRRQDDVDGQPRAWPWRCYGLRTLVIDLDPQGNASTALGVEHTVGTPSIYDALVGDSSLAEVVHPTTASPNLLCVPATIDLAGAEIELVSVVAREHRLRRAIEAYVHELPPEQRPHYVLIDCPPSLGLLTLNALVAGDEVLIPIQCEYYALEGLGQLLNNIDLVRQHLNPGIAVRTILLTMYDGRTKLADQVADEVRNHFGDLVLHGGHPAQRPGLRGARATASRCSPTTRARAARPATSRRPASSPSAGVRPAARSSRAGGAAPAAGSPGGRR